MAGSFSFDFVLLITAEVLAEDPVVAGVDALGVDSRPTRARNNCVCSSWAVAETAAAFTKAANMSVFD